ncbi:uncharacterized protein LOC126899677 isoform X2 [Daktulosphaira vitifoliae]|uniref:uncharacterized protein LOC126899677 isoform X2 n=1 Tax=Daktulosphaira vitifoliae TaxID=58002 RepID=UPI0021A9C56C|nr:uncharacterized protein LOC126899677 isoform X2 [Daktulosphaira vitifoliae]
MMLMKIFTLFFFLILVKSLDLMLPIKQDLLNCFDKYGLGNDQIIDMKWNTEIIYSEDENNRSNIGFAMANDVCLTLLDKGIDSDIHYKRCLELAKECCKIYVEKVDTLNMTVDSGEMVIIPDNPYEHLVKDRSEEKKVLSTLLEEDGMIVENDCKPVEGAQIVVLSEDTKDVDFIKMKLYI